MNEVEGRLDQSPLDEKCRGGRQFYQNEDFIAIFVS